MRETLFSPEAPVSLIPASVAHAALLAAIHRRCFEDAWNEAAMTTFLAQPGSLGRVAACCDPVGFILCRQVEGEMEILTFGVVPEARRLGVGRRLLQSALEGAQASGARRVFLEVAVINNAAVRLYEGAGFAPVGRRPRYYRARDGSSVDAVILAWEPPAVCVGPIAGQTRSGRG